MQVQSGATRGHCRHREDDNISFRSDSTRSNMNNLFFTVLRLCSFNLIFSYFVSDCVYYVKNWRLNLPVIYLTGQKRSPLQVVFQVSPPFLMLHITSVRSLSVGTISVSSQWSQSLFDLLPVYLLSSQLQVEHHCFSEDWVSASHYSSRYMILRMKNRVPASASHYYGGTCQTDPLSWHKITACLLWDKTRHLTNQFLL